MKKILRLLIGISLCYTSSAQVSFTGSSSSISTGTNAATVIVDNALTITGPTSFDGARVAVSSNFVSGDILGYTNALLPSGVSGSYNAANGILTFTGSASASDYQTLLRSVTFQATATGAGDREVLFSLGTAIYNSATNHFYAYVSGSLTWTAAKADAASKSYYGLTGYLATITSAAENQFIQLKLGNSGWIGSSDEYTMINTATGAGTYANQSAAEGNFYWVTGPEAGTMFSTGNTNPVSAGGQYINWNSGEPNNWASNEHYAAIYTNGAWNDISNAGDASTNGYIIEYGGLATDPTVDAIHSRTITVPNTLLSATGYNNVYQLNNSVIVDTEITVGSGGLLTNARVTLSGNFTSGDALSFFAASLPSGVTASYNSSTGVLAFTGTASPAAWQALFRTVRFQSTSSSTSDRTVTFSFGNLISGSNGHFYEFVSSTGNWPSAKAAAEARSYMGLQGYLATVTSQAENDLIWQKLSADGWLGGSDEYSTINDATGSTTYANQSSSEGSFYWVTGPEKGQLISTGNFPSTTTSSYSNWYNGEPNNYNNNEHYIEIYSSSSQPGTWNDLPMNNNVGYVVEYGDLPTDPDVVLSSSRTLVIGAVLPVNNFLFGLEQKTNGIVLNWSADEAKDVATYEILYSATGKNFIKIAEVAAATNEKSKYSFIDTRRLPGKNFYKIAIIDNNGHTNYSLIRSATIKTNVSLAPTIVNNQFLISQPGTSQLAISMVNASGAVVFQKYSNAQRTSVDASFLKSGVYFVVVSNGSEVLESFKIVKQ